MCKLVQSYGRALLLVGGWWPQNTKDILGPSLDSNVSRSKAIAVRAVRSS